jgi:signal transduction histidine kinase
MAIYECQNTGQPVRLDDLRYTTPAGKERFLGLTINPLKDENNQPSGFLLLGTDITRRRVLESQLAQSQKLESIGSLAAGIAHEINTPIQYVGDNTRFLNDAFHDLVNVISACKEIVSGAGPQNDAASIIARLSDAIEATDFDYLIHEIPNAIDQSLEGVARVAHIVRAMKDFSHPGNEDMTAIDLNRAIESTITIARNEWKYVADVVTDFGENLAPVPCYPNEFNQVVLNMILNASHAIGDVVTGSNTKGTITISTREQAGFAEIRISDTGTGIAPEILSRIFDPFFTTKPVGRGTGQGLSISHTVIVEKHRGAIDVSTEVGRGTTFTIRLPHDRKGP